MAFDKDRKCPTCGSEKIVEEKKGFHPKGGYFLLGVGGGLIAAAIEANKTHFVCKVCGKTWQEVLFNPWSFFAKCRHIYNAVALIYKLKTYVFRIYSIWIFIRNIQERSAGCCIVLELKQQIVGWQEQMLTFLLHWLEKKGQQKR
jgi:transposase-like protein